MAGSTQKAPSPLLQRNFALLWAGRMVSVLGDLIFNTTLILWISTILARGQSWAPLAVSGTSIAATLPVLLLGSLAGVFVDRWNKRRTMVWMDGVRALLILLLFASLPFRFLTTWQLAIIYLVVCGLNICSQLFTPSSLVLFGDIVADDQWERASGIFQLITPLAAIIAPPIATFLFFTTGLFWALIFNALSFVVSLLTLLALALPARQDQEQRSQEQWSEQRSRLFKELLEGFQFFVRNTTLVTLLVVSVLIVAFDSIFGALGIFFVTQNLHTSATLYGYISSAAGVGAVLGALLAGPLGARIGSVRLLGFSTLATGVVIIIFAHTTSFPIALLLAFVIGLCMVATNVPIMPLMLQVTPRPLLGRVEAVLTPTMTLSALLAVAIAGWLDSGALASMHLVLAGLTFGPIDTIFSVAGVLTFLAGVYTLIALRRLPDKQSEETRVETEAAAREG